MAALGGCGEKRKLPQQQVIGLNIKPGTPVAEVARQAELHLNYSVLLDNSPITMDRPVRIHYADPEHAFELPPSRFVFLTQRAGIVTSIETTTALDYMNLQTAHETALHLMTGLKAANWQSVQVFPNDFATVERMNREKAPGEELQKVYGTWQLGSVSASVYLKEHSNGPGDFPRPRFLPGVDIFDSTLQKSLEAKMFDRRKARNGSINKSLPLLEWVH